MKWTRMNAAEKKKFSLHVRNFSSSSKNLKEEGPIVFNEEFDKVKNRNIALNCRVPKTKDDWAVIKNEWAVIIEYLTEADRKTISVGGMERLVKSEPPVEFYSFNITKIETNKLFESLSEQEISELIVDYFDNDLSWSKFIIYCELVQECIKIKFPKEIASALLIGIFEQFGKKLNGEILFQVWKNKKFNFISYNELLDYEIPERVMREYEAELNISDLKRITQYSYAENFLNDYVSSRLIFDESTSLEKAESLFELIQFAEKSKRKKYSDDFNDFYFYKGQPIFNDNKIQEVERIKILENVHVKFQLVLLVGYAEKYGYEKTFELLNTILIKENNFFYGFKVTEHLFEVEYWKDKKHGGLLISFSDYVNKNATTTEQFALFFKGLVKDVPEDIALQNAKTLTIYQCKKVFDNRSQNKDLIFSMLVTQLEKINKHSYEFFCDLAQKFLDTKNFLEINKQIIQMVSTENYFGLWINNKVKIEPNENYDERLLNHFKVPYLYHMTHKSNLESILKNGLLSHQEAHKGIVRVDISDKKVNSRREKREPIFNRSIHEYVALYFNPKNPMLFKRKNEQNEIIILALDRNLILLQQAIFTNGNAASNDTKFFNSLKNLRELDWDCINNEYWNDYEDGKRIKCSEVLIYPIINASLIKQIYCNTQNTGNFILEKTKNYNHISVFQNDSFYFQENDNYSYW